MQHEQTRPKVLFVMGSTGVGKSDLAIQIAVELGTKYSIKAEIINADAMQIFEGLDIGTNKPSVQDLQTVKHHLFGYVDCMNANYTVQDYVEKCDSLISALHAQSILPIVVGGTNYYIAALAYQDYLVKKRKIEQEQPIRTDIEYTYERLCLVDPETAKKVHPHNSRKIRRYLQVYDDTQVPYSTAVPTTTIHTLRYDCRFIYLSPDDRANLYNRTDARVLKMIERGIIQEVEQFEQKFSILKLLEKDPTALQSGILQCIGFKEFVPYLKDKKEEQKCIESLQTATRNYARKQENWFRNTWASAGSTLLNPPILYELIVSGDKQEWSEKIVPAGLSIAVSLWDSSIETNCDVKKYLVIEPRSGVSKTETWEKHTCEICERTYNGPQEWADHLRSKLHKVRKSKLNKKIKM